MIPCQKSPKRKLPTCFGERGAGLSDFEDGRWSEERQDVDLKVGWKIGERTRLTGRVWILILTTISFEVGSWWWHLLDERRTGGDETLDECKVTQSAIREFLCDASNPCCDDVDLHLNLTTERCNWHRGSWLNWLAWKRWVGRRWGIHFSRLENRESTLVRLKTHHNQRTIRDKFKVERINRSMVDEIKRRRSSIGKDEGRMWWQRLIKKEVVQNKERWNKQIQ